MYPASPIIYAWVSCMRMMKITEKYQFRTEKCQFTPAKCRLHAGDSSLNCLGDVLCCAAVGT
jgi:hypothetical protein